MDNYPSKDNLLVLTQLVTTYPVDYRFTELLDKYVNFIAELYAKMTNLCCILGCLQQKIELNLI